MENTNVAINMVDGKTQEIKGKSFIYTLLGTEFNFVLHNSWDVVGRYTISHLESGRSVYPDFHLAPNVAETELREYLVKLLDCYITILGVPKVLAHLNLAVRNSGSTYQGIEGVYKTSDPVTDWHNSDGGCDYASNEVSKGLAFAYTVFGTAEESS